MLNKEVMPARSYRLEITAIIAAGASLVACVVPATRELTPVGDAPWSAQVEEAMDIWNNVLRDCDASFVIGDAGLPVKLYTEAWPEAPDVVGFYSGAEVAIRETVPEHERAILVHELGHVIGIRQHTDPAEDPMSVMQAEVRTAIYVPTVGDILRAEEALGCR